MVRLIRRLITVIFIVAQLRSCAAFWCSASKSDRFAAAALPVPLPAQARVIGTALLSGGDLVIVAGEELSPTGYVRTLLRRSERTGAQPLASVRMRHVIGERVVSAGTSSWWYSVAGNFENRWGAVFIREMGDAAPPVTFVELPLFGPAVWVPLQGATPRGLYIAGREALSIMEVGPAGVLNRWTIAEQPSIHPWLWTAHELSDGTHALISADGPDRNERRVVLRVLDPRDSTHVATTVLRESGPYSRITSTINATGNLAIVALTTGGRVEAVVIDPRKPAPKWLELAEGADETRIPGLVATDHDFATTWLTRRGELLARSFTRTSAGALVAMVATPPQRGEALPFFVHRDGDNLLFVWQTDDIHRRNLPAALSGYQALIDLRKLICEAPPT